MLVKKKLIVNTEKQSSKVFEVKRNSWGKNRWFEKEKFFLGFVLFIFLKNLRYLKKKNHEKFPPKNFFLEIFFCYFKNVFDSKYGIKKVSSFLHVKKRNFNKDYNRSRLVPDFENFSKKIFFSFVPISKKKNFLKKKNLDKKFQNNFFQNLCLCNKIFRFFHHANSSNEEKNSN